MNFIKNKFFLIFSAAFMLVCACIVVISAIYSKGYTDKRNASSEEISHIYTVKEYNGRIGIFSADSNELLRILDVYLSTLPSEDVEKLAVGIKIRSESELQQIIEDYSS